jgi:hypothetical protein
LAEWQAKLGFSVAFLSSYRAILGWYLTIRGEGKLRTNCNTAPKPRKKDAVRKKKTVNISFNTK